MPDKFQQVDWVKVVHDKIYFILAAACVCAAAALLAGFVLPKTYQSALVLNVGKVSYATSLNGAEREDVTKENLETVQTVKDLIESEPFMAEVIARTKLGTTPVKLLKKVKVKINTDAKEKEENRQVVITGKAGTPEKAVQLVNTIAGLLMERHKVLYDQAMEVHHKYEDELESKVNALSQEISGMNATLHKMETNPKVDAPAVILLEAGIEDKEKNLVNIGRELSLVRRLGHTDVMSEETRVAVPAFLPTVPVSPKPLLNVLAGLFAGAVFAASYAFYKAAVEAKGL